MCAASTAVSLFALEANGIFNIHAIPSVYDIIVALAMTFVYCYLSEGLTLNLCDVGNSFYGVAWNRSPVKVQALFMLPIQHSQQEFRLKGAGLVDCSLIVFGKVNRPIAVDKSSVRKRSDHFRSIFHWPAFIALFR